MEKTARAFVYAPLWNATLCLDVLMVSAYICNAYLLPTFYIANNFIRYYRVHVISVVGHFICFPQSVFVNYYRVSLKEISGQNFTYGMKHATS